MAVEAIPLKIPESAEAVRAAILNSGAPWVGLDHLLEYCWGIGIPVVQVSKLPAGATGFAGLCAVVENRPVIIVAAKNKQPAWLLFIVAHELGHICRGHLENNSVLIDEELAEGEGQEDQEREANEFALEVLAAGRRYSAGHTRLKAPALATAARRLASKHQVDPGHVILNYGHTMKFWPVANAALNLVNTDADAPAMIAEAMARHLDAEEVPADSLDFLSLVTGVELCALP